MAASQTSENFRIAKVVAILIVAVAHFHLGFYLWIPAAVALFVFGFSSAYFTAEKHDDSISACRVLAQQTLPAWVPISWSSTHFCSAFLWLKEDRGFAPGRLR